LSNEGGNQYIGRSRGFKTKGNTYKDRYVDKKCPECGHDRAYQDVWKTRIAYTCLKRACRHKFYEAIVPVPKVNEKESE
jgi:hypothetical protein